MGYILVAGEGFEPSTFGLWGRWTLLWWFVTCCYQVLWSVISQRFLP